MTDEVNNTAIDELDEDINLLELDCLFELGAPHLNGKAVRNAVLICEFDDQSLHYEFFRPETWPLGRYERILRASQKVLRRKQSQHRQTSGVDEKLRQRSNPEEMVKRVENEKQEINEVAKTDEDLLKITPVEVTDDETEENSEDSKEDDSVRAQAIAELRKLQQELDNPNGFTTHAQGLAAVEATLEDRIAETSKREEERRNGNMSESSKKVSATTDSTTASSGGAATEGGRTTGATAKSKGTSGSNGKSVKVVKRSVKTTK